MKKPEQVSQILSSSKTAIAIMISSGQISKMNKLIPYILHILFLLKKLSPQKVHVKLWLIMMLA